MTNPLRNLLLLSLCCGGVISAEPDLTPGWPQANRPFGNFNPRKYGVTLIDDIMQAKEVWTSEENDLGYCKTSASGFIATRAKASGHPGAANGIIAAEGKIFAASFHPYGEAWSEKLVSEETIAKFSPEEQNRLWQNLSIEAEDFVVAIDMTTGKTIWKTIEDRKGLFRGMGKRDGWGVSPAYFRGKVFSMTTIGYVNAYDASTGKKIWEADLGTTRENWEKDKMECLKTKGLASAIAESTKISLVVADGVLVVPLFINDTLRGLDSATGKTLWEIPNATTATATPAIWRHQDHDYILASNSKGETRLVAPKDGKILWTHKNAVRTHFSLAPSENHVLLNVGSKEGTFKSGNRKNQPWMLLGCYELSLEGAKLIWTMPDQKEFWHEPSFEASDWRKYIICDGYIYYYSAYNDPNFKNYLCFSILDEKTGAVLFEKDDNFGKNDAISQGQLNIIENCIFHIPDASHSARVSIRLWTADPKKFRPLGNPGLLPNLQGTTNYNIFIENPYVDGRIYMRSHEGTVHCYDLRKNTANTWLNLQCPNPVQQGNPKNQSFVGLQAEFAPDSSANFYISLPKMASLSGKSTTVKSPNSRQWSGDVNLLFGKDVESWHFEVNTTALTGSYQRTIPALATPRRLLLGSVK